MTKNQEIMIDALASCGYFAATHGSNKATRWAQQGRKFLVVRGGEYKGDDTAYAFVLRDEWTLDHGRLQDLEELGIDTIGSTPSYWLLSISTELPD